MDYIVVRRLPLGERTAEAGEVIPASVAEGWAPRRLKQLMEQRYLAPHYGGEPAARDRKPRKE